MLARTHCMTMLVAVGFRGLGVACAVPRAALRRTVCACLVAMVAWLGGPTVVVAGEPNSSGGAAAPVRPGHAVHLAVADDPAAEDAVEPDEDLSELSLEELIDVEVVGTASRHAQKKSTLPYAVSVITAADIRASGARTIPDALRLAPGIDVADLNSGASAVSVRGMHGFLGRTILVLVDGRQIFD